MNITILEQAFVGMITSALEVFKKESFGFLIGEVHKHHYLIADSYTFQRAKRDYEKVFVKKQIETRVNSCLSFFTSSKVIGDFHSHPKGPHYLSDFDKIQIIKGNTPIAILVSIYDTKKTMKWSTNEDMSISGTIGKRYLVKLSGFERHGKRVRQVKIVCPYIRKINQLKLYSIIKKC